ncbi:BnaC07g33800D [Brassica napus]|uniref:BnaC07g33800D protein n=1 Tax=Brassica napus TaxID=3708 RepID=A0A078F8L8_BRANA|nr:BnaC07g33800D [Brassica napus]
MLIGAEGFYAINNPFQTNGPKWFSEIKWLDFDMYLRMDLPGVGSDPDVVDISVDDSKKGVTIKALAPCLNINDSFPRSYDTYIGLGCHCCEISSVDNPQVTDGVLRLILSTTPIKGDDGAPGPPQQEIHSLLFLGTDPYADPESTGKILQPHPGLSEGPASAYEYKQLLDGSVYVRLDMPGVSDVDINVDFVNYRLIVVGDAPTVSHDSGGRSVEHNVENGVVRLFIHPT